jgi:hypothetical protein
MFQQMQAAQNPDQGPEPVDNTVDNNPTESPTPELDSHVENFSMGINR